jgi:hypothetical protein
MGARRNIDKSMKGTKKWWVREQFEHEGEEGKGKSKDDRIDK